MRRIVGVLDVNAQPIARTCVDDGAWNTPCECRLVHIAGYDLIPASGPNTGDPGTPARSTPSAAQPPHRQGSSRPRVPCCAYSLAGTGLAVRRDRQARLANSPLSSRSSDRYYAQPWEFSSRTRIDISNFAVAADTTFRCKSLAA